MIRHEMLALALRFGYTKAGKILNIEKPRSRLCKPSETRAEGLVAWFSAILLSFSLGCRSNASRTDPEDAERRARLSAALSDVDRSSGEARRDARIKLLTSRLDLYATARDVDLLPRFEALLRSPDDGDVALGIALTGEVAHPTSLPKLWLLVSHPNVIVRDQAMETIASQYHDPKLVPTLQRTIERHDSSRAPAIRSLRWFIGDPAVVAYLKELLQDPKCVSVAAEVLKESRISYDPKLAAVAQRSYSRPAEGIEIDHPEDWSPEEFNGYSKIFRNDGLHAYYGYKILYLKRAAKAHELLTRMERAEHMHNEIPVEQTELPAESFTKTLASEAAEGRYTLHRDGLDLIHRVVLLVQDDREILVAGEAPSANIKEFNSVFDRMWPTIRITAPDLEFATRLKQAIEEGTRRQAASQLPSQTP